MLASLIRTPSIRYTRVCPEDRTKVNLGHGYYDFNFCLNH